MSKSKFQKIWDKASINSKGLVALAASYLRSFQTRNYSPRTYQATRWYLGSFLYWCDQQAITAVDDLTRPVVEQYYSYLGNCYSQRCGGILTENSRRQHIMYLDLFFRWLVKQHHLLFNPASHIELPKPTKPLPRNTLTQQEIESIINQPDINKPIGIRDRAIFEILYSTGIRACELIRLKVDDIDIARGTLWINQGKGQKDRVVPIGDRAIKWIEKYMHEVRGHMIKGRNPKALFLTRYGQAFRSEMTLGCVVRPYIKAANIGKKGACHLFRHTMATLMLENGADIRYIQEILGHADLQTTQIYTKVTITKLKQVHTLTHPAELCNEILENEQ